MICALKGGKGGMMCKLKGGYKRGHYVQIIGWMDKGVWKSKGGCKRGYYDVQIKRVDR